MQKPSGQELKKVVCKNTIQIKVMNPSLALRLMIGLPFLKTEDILKGVKTLEKCPVNKKPKNIEIFPLQC